MFNMEEAACVSGPLGKSKISDIDGLISNFFFCSGCTSSKNGDWVLIKTALELKTKKADIYSTNILS